MTEHRVEHAPDVELSALGRQRRDEMLGELQGALRRRRRIRRARRAALVSAIPIIAIASAVIMTRPSPVATPPERPIAMEPVEDEPDSVAPVAGRQGRIQMVSRRGAAIVKLDQDASSRVARISDEQLVSTLAEMNRPSGLIRTDQEVRLTAAVTDAEIRTQTEGAS